MMSFAKSFTFRGLALATLALAGAALAQNPGDWPTFKGSNDRQGYNGAPNTSGPGFSYLTWFDPNPIATDRTIIVDNTDFGDTAVNFPGQGPFPTPLNGSGANSTTYNPLNPTPNPLTRWAFPQLDEEAGFPYLLPIRPLAIGANPQNSGSRFPAYVYTHVTQGDPNRDPLVGYQPGDVRTFNYVFNGSPGLPRNYALSAWIPVGPMRVGAATVFPQRYYVYRIQWGPAINQSYTDVVDTYASGGGWVRLGNGGAATNKVFPWDGANSIVVSLYNTVPRNRDGSLTMLYTPNNGAAPNHVEDDVKKYVVYADAMRAEPVTGSYVATPVSARTNPADATTSLLFAAKNNYTVASAQNDTKTISQGTLTTYKYNPAGPNWVPSWRYSPGTESNDTNLTVDDSLAAIAGTFTPNTTYTRYAGADCHVAPIKAVADGTVRYQPTLNNGSYEIYIYLPGDPKDVNGIPIPTFGSTVQYQVTAEGVTTTYTLDQGTGGGWVRLADRRFQVSDTFPTVTVIVSNQSATPADLTKQAYADAIRFVGDKNQEITSTPVYANAKIRKNDIGHTVEATNVVIVADEFGKIHCLDAVGNGDGTTTEYWSYPSSITPDPNILDPLQDGDGVDTRLAEMPTSFDLSSALVQNVGGTDFLYIGSTNGRVYCINMTGRGDYTRQTAGTTTRQWTYPSTYPSVPAFPSSSLGSFKGSITFANTAAGATVFVPTTQGRIYALNARGNNDKSTSIRWTYPLLTNDALGAIVMTPAFSQNALFFGTLRKNDKPGRFFSLNAATGAVNWELNSQPAPPGFPITGREFLDDFLSSPAVVTNKVLLNDNTANGAVLYALNQNQLLYAIDADTGNVLWMTDELFSGSRGALTYTTLQAYNNAGVLTNTPLIMVPTQDGRVAGLFANPDINFVNRFNGKLAWVYYLEGADLTSSISVANGSMFVGDNLGFLYAFSNVKGAYGPGDWFPGQPGIPPNDPAGDIFRKAKLKLVTRDAFAKLRLPPGAAGQLTYAQALNGANSFIRNPLAFEWGETAYILVYDFPYVTQNTAGDPVPPPIVSVSFNVDGRSVRGVAVEARQFPSTGVPALKDIAPNVGIPDSAHGGDLPVDGYAVLAFPFQGGGSNALPPGDATISFSISTQSLNPNQAQQQVILDPATSVLPFKMANPLAIEVVARPDKKGEIGLDTNPSGPERLTNGSVAIGGVNKNLLGSTTGYIPHGLTGGTFVNVYDVSMMGLLRPDGFGLDGVRLARSDLARQAGAAGVMNALNPVLYPGFEDLPVNSPNTSLDYPDIPRESVKATKDPSGDAENPLFNGVQLKAPLYQDGGITRALQEGDDPNKRVFVPTQFELDVSVPRFQPPVLFPAAGTGSVLDSIGNTWNTGYLQGYLGRINVFVDSFQNGNLDIAQREAYRSFNLVSAVPPDQQIAVSTPSVDLGSLPTGAGFSALGRPGTGFNPTGATNVNLLNPWDIRANNPFVNNFKTFTVLNGGNVNLLNLRLAKADATGPSQLPVFFTSLTNDPLAWLEAGWSTGGADLYNGNLWTNMDWQFSPWSQAQNPARNVILQKARVADVVPSQLSVNPIRRPNPNLNVASSSTLFDATKFPPGDPKVTVSVPIGFPAGRYHQNLSVIEEEAANDPILPTWNLVGGQAEPISNPNFDLLFNVRETRLTTTLTPGGDRMLDDNGTHTGESYYNQQPTVVRDAYGSLIVAFASNRPSWVFDGTAPIDPQSRGGIYIANLDNGSTFNGSGITVPSGSPTAPLSDLNYWLPSGTGVWYKKGVQRFPTTNPNTVFDRQPGETVLDQTLVYRNPSFPQNGVVNPYNPSQIFTAMYMGLVGEVQKSTNAGRVTENRIIATQVGLAADGTATPNGLQVMTNDPLMAKGKPSMLQTSAGAMVFFTGITGGQSNIYYSQLDANGFGPNNLIPLGNGFVSVTNPSASGRIYQGTPNGNLQPGDGIVELTFAGKLRGRPNTEVFMGRLLAKNGQTMAIDAQKVLDPNQIFAWQSYVTGERIAAEGSGMFRTRGVVWNLEAPITLMQSNASGTPVSIIDDSTRQYDPQTGIISYDTKIGGKVYLDPNLGTVRFANGAPPGNAVVTLSYQPAFLRVTPLGTEGYASPVGLFDSRLLSSLAYWSTPGGGQPGPNVTWTNDRQVFTYTRAAAGKEAQARPYVSTMRLGVQLPFRIDATAGVTVTGGTGPAQVDPSNGRIYFEAQDENRPVTINYTAINDAGQSFSAPAVTATVSWVVERSDEALPIEQAVNESALTSFLDPFNFVGQRRPPLMWMFWTSTRSGNPDIYFQSVAPNWSPIAVTGQ